MTRGVDIDSFVMQQEWDEERDNKKYGDDSFDFLSLSPKVLEGDDDF